MGGGHVTELRALIESYDAAAALESATTPPSAWYTDSRIYELERRAVFGSTWQMVGRAEQLMGAGQYITADVAGEPIVVVRGRDGVIRGFFNVCRHHAAEVVTESAGCTESLRCPYHGWTYSLDGTLKSVAEFDGVRDFDKSANGLVPVQVDVWEKFVFVRLFGSVAGESIDALPVEHHELARYLGLMIPGVARLRLGDLHFFERRTYDLACNWKVYVDNFLDGGYHVPHIHKGLGSVLDYSRYTIENRDRYCLQSSPVESGGESETAAVRGGEMAYYYWLYPNFMLNWYEGVMDSNLVLPLGLDRTRVVFDFYFADTSAGGADFNAKSMAVGERIQQEDIDICESVQRGLRSQAYDVGRLSARRESGEHHFHRLLHAGLTREMAAGRPAS